MPHGFITPLHDGEERFGSGCGVHHSAQLEQRRRHPTLPARIDPVARGTGAGVMVVDNGSEPADLERLRSGIARWGLAVELVETGENLGFGGGCDVGMRLALERPERVQTWGGGGILHTLNQCRWDV